MVKQKLSSFAAWLRQGQRGVYWAKFFAQLIGLLLIGAVLCFGLLTTSYRMPGSAQRLEHINSFLENFGALPYDCPIEYGNGVSLVDNYVDILMLDIAANDLTQTEPLSWRDAAQTALLSPMRSHWGSPYQELGCYLRDQGVLSPEAAYTLSLRQESEPSPESPYLYGRYWHGYVLWLRPLLTLFTFEQILGIVGMVQLFLIALVLGLAWCRQRKLVFPLVVLYAGIGLPSVLCSMPFFSDCMLTSIGLLVILCARPRRGRRFAGLLFFLLGAASAFFGFLDYPALTLLAPLGLLLVQRAELDVPREGLKTMVLCTICWALGFVGFWAMKWLLLLIGAPELLGSVSQQFSVRSSAGSDGRFAALFYTTLRNSHFFSRQPFGKAFVLIFPIVLLHELCTHGNIDLRRLVPRYVLPLLLSAGPFVWFFFISEHSSFHAKFVFRLLIVPYFAIALTLALPPLPGFCTPAQKLRTKLLRGEKHDRTAATKPR